MRTSVSDSRVAAAPYLHRAERDRGCSCTLTNFVLAWRHASATALGVTVTELIDFPVNDADNHMYETPDAFTKYLPKEYEGVIKYVQVNGRTKIAIKNVISDYIPNPTFEVVARPGAQEEYFQIGNPEGKSRREIMGKPMRAPDAFF